MAKKTKSTRKPMSAAARKQFAARMAAARAKSSKPRKSAKIPSAMGKPTKAARANSKPRSGKTRTTKRTVVRERPAPVSSSTRVLW